jgi:hypothetical protein
VSKRKQLGALLCSLLVSCGCAYTHTLGALSKEEQSRFDKLSDGREFSVILNDGSVETGSHLTVGPTQLSWLEVPSGLPRQGSFEEIHSVRSRDRVTGGVEGLMYGVLIGAAGGAILGYAGGEENCSGGEFCFDRSGSAYFGGIAFGAAGGIFGAILGGLRGTRDTYYPPTEHGAAIEDIKSK